MKGSEWRLGPRGLESLPSPLGYAGHQPARFEALSEASGRTGYLRRRWPWRGPRGCAQQLPWANETATRRGSAGRRQPREEGRGVPAEKPLPLRSDRGFHRHATHPPAPKSGELFHRLRRLRLHNHLQTEIQVSCSQSFQRFVIECAINPENEVRKKKGGGGSTLPVQYLPESRRGPKSQGLVGWKVVCFLKAASNAAGPTKTPNPRQPWKRRGERVFKERQ